jgi:hypothetical protein
MAQINNPEKTEVPVSKSTQDPSTEPQLLFSNSNYALVVLGILFIAIGFILMAGGGSEDPNVFDAEAIYSHRRITVAPILVLIGFAIEIAAILKKP